MTYHEWADRARAVVGVGFGVFALGWILAVKRTVRRAIRWFLLGARGRHSR